MEYSTSFSQPLGSSADMYGTCTRWLVPCQCWCHRDEQIGVLALQEFMVWWENKEWIPPFLQGGKWNSKGLENLFKVNQLVKARVEVSDLVSSPNHCMMLLPKATDKCGKEGTGCPSPPCSHMYCAYCRKCPDAGGKSRIQGFMGPRKPLLRTTLHLIDGLRGAT